MQVNKCDICKKKISFKEEQMKFLIRDGNCSSFEICEKCASPIKKILVDKKLIKPESKK